MDYHNQPDFSDRNTILYGHNMKDGTMFAALDAYAQESVCREYPFFYIYTPEHAIVYEIYACYTGWVESAAYSYQFPAEETFLEFLQETSRSSLYDAKGIPDDSSRIVTLSTCTNISRQQRFIIHGMRRESK